MLLAIDIGNTNIKLGVWNGRFWQHRWRLLTAQEKTSDEYGLALRALLREHNLNGVVSQVIICSVVPAVTATLTEVSQSYLGAEALQVTAALDTGIQVQADDPSAVGADRIANAAAVHYQYPGPKIIVDMGTATKFEIVTGDGVFPGGVIAPGLRITADALASRAAQLRQVELCPPPTVIGTNTIHAVQSGLIYGYVGLVEGILNRLFREHPDQSAPCLVVGTGGLIDHIAPHTTLIRQIDNSLTLTGLRIINERVQGPGSTG